ncbi:MAG: hypothetical protein ACK56I_07070, partial [bacterium]
ARASAIARVERRCDRERVLGRLRRFAGAGRGAAARGRGRDGRRIDRGDRDGPVDDRTEPRGDVLDVARVDVGREEAHAAAVARDRALDEGGVVRAPADPEEVLPRVGSVAG